MQSWSIRLATLSLACLLAGRAHAQADLFSQDTFHGLVEARLSTASGERSWLDGGFGKTGVSAGGDEPAALSQAALEWTPKFNFAVSAVVSAFVQPTLDPSVDLGEAYLKLKAPPSAAGRLSARVGLFYPPVSMEHDGTAWTTPDMLSASALNSWIGEEVKVAGLEVTWQRSLGAHQIEAAAALFGGNDTAGTLLTFRGWALGETRTGLRTAFGLPPLSQFAAQFQAGETYPFRELDRRAGYYARLEWRPPATVSFNALYYDNGGDRTAVDSEGQWSWDTRFTNLGFRWEPSGDTRVLIQAMSGRTLMGYVMPGGIWFDVGFQSAYLLAQRRVGDDMVSGRIDAFRTRDHTFQAIDDNNETGWAVTASWRHRLAPHLDLLLEAQHVDSKRPARLLAHEAARQDQDVLQSALRFSF